MKEITILSSKNDGTGGTSRTFATHENAPRFYKLFI